LALGHSGSLGTNAGGHALSRALGFARTRYLIAASQGASQPHVLCLANHASLQILISTSPKLEPAILLLPPTRIRGAQSKSSTNTSHCLGAMNSIKIFAPLGRRCKLHENPHKVDVMIGVSVSACRPPEFARVDCVHHSGRTAAKAKARIS
jgi:hypothetical protein